MWLILEYLNSHLFLGGCFKAPGDLPKGALTQEALHQVGGGDSIQQASTTDLRVWRGREGNLLSKQSWSVRLGLLFLHNISDK